jgi:hypothetical protein
MPAAGRGLVTARHRGARAGVFGEAHGAEKLSRCGHRFRQQAVCIGVGGMRLVAQPPIGSPMHAAGFLRKRFDGVLLPPSLILIFCARRVARAAGTFCLLAWTNPRQRRQANKGPAR